MSNREFVEGRRDDGWMHQQRYGRDDREGFARDERFGRDQQQRWGRDRDEQQNPYERSMQSYREPSFAYGQEAHGRFQGYNQQGYNQQGYAQQQRQLGRPPKGFQRSDERIKEEICEFIMRTHWLDAENVVIEVQGGEVTLSGTVEDRQQKRALEDLSTEVLGVKDVSNHIRVQPQQPPERQQQEREQQEREQQGGRSRKPTA